MILLSSCSTTIDTPKLESGTGVSKNAEATVSEKPKASEKKESQKAKESPIKTEEPKKSDSTPKDKSETAGNKGDKVEFFRQECYDSGSSSGCGKSSFTVDSNDKSSYGQQLSQGLYASYKKAIKNTSSTGKLPVTDTTKIDTSCLISYGVVISEWGGKEVTFCDDKGKSLKAVSKGNADPLEKVVVQALRDTGVIPVVQ